MNIIETIASINDQVIFHKLPVLNNLYGLRTSIFYPIDNDSHYNNDSKFSYSDNPNQTKQILIVNSFQEVLAGSFSYDPYVTPNPEAIVLYKDIIPTNSLLKVFKGSGFSMYRVDNDPKVITTNDGKYLYVKHKLIAVS